MPDRLHHRGFTLIELMTVIVIVGVLLAVALPRLLNMRQEAHRATVAAVAGDFRAAAVLASQLCRLRSWANRDNLPGLGNGTVDFNPNCYPADTSGSNLSAANAARCVRIFQGIMTSSYVVNTTTAANVDFRVTLVGGNCRFTLQRDTSTVRRFDYTPGTGTVLNLVNP